MENKGNEYRRELYRLLGRIYLLEFEESQIEALKNMAFPDIQGDTAAEFNLAEGYALVKQYLADQSKENAQIAEDLAVDYAQIFLSAGDQSGKSAYPYESVYTDGARQIYGETTTKVEKILGEAGLKLREDMFKVYEDHIGVELEYMANLIEQGDKTLDEQKSFLKEHLLNWYGSFTSDVVRYATTDFYKGWAKITNGFLGLEKEYYGL